MRNLLKTIAVCAITMMTLNSYGQIGTNTISKRDIVKKVDELDEKCASDPNCEKVHNKLPHVQGGSCLGKSTYTIEKDENDLCKHTIEAKVQKFIGSKAVCITRYFVWKMPCP